MVAAGAVVTPGKTVPSGEVWAGNPAKLLRKLEEEETGFIAQAANDYAALAAVHAAENAKTPEEIQVGALDCCKCLRISLVPAGGREGFHRALVIRVQVHHMRVDSAVQL